MATACVGPRYKCTAHPPSPHVKLCLHQAILAKLSQHKGQTNTWRE